MGPRGSDKAIPTCWEFHYLFSILDCLSCWFAQAAMYKAPYTIPRPSPTRTFEISLKIPSELGRQHLRGIRAAHPLCLASQAFQCVRHTPQTSIYTVISMDDTSVTLLPHLFVE